MIEDHLGHREHEAFKVCLVQQVSLERVAKMEEAEKAKLGKQAEGSETHGTEIMG